MVKKLTNRFGHPIELNFGPSRRPYFSLQNDSSRAKMRVKMDEIPTKYQNPNLKFHFFQVKHVVLGPTLHKKTVSIGQELE